MAGIPGLGAKVGFSVELANQQPRRRIGGKVPTLARSPRGTGQDLLPGADLGLPAVVGGFKLPLALGRT